MIENRKFTEADAQALLPDGPDEFYACAFTGMKFAGVHLESSQFYHCSFKNCSLAGQDITGSVFCETLFESCSLVGVNWAAVKRVSDLQFIECKLDYSTFQKLDLRRLQCRKCSIVDVDFSDANLLEAKFSDSVLAGANFSRSSLLKADFRSARSYFIDPQYCKIKGAKFSLPEAAAIIIALGAEVEL